MARSDDDEDEDAVQAEVLDRRLDEGDVTLVRGIERAAEEAGHSTSTTSGSRMPAERSASRASSSDRPPTTR